MKTVKSNSRMQAWSDLRFTIFNLNPPNTLRKKSRKWRDTTVDSHPRLAERIRTKNVFSGLPEHALRGSLIDEPYGRWNRWNPLFE